jgi:hypothetical protein
MQFDHELIYEEAFPLLHATPSSRENDNEMDPTSDSCYIFCSESA